MPSMHVTWLHEAPNVASSLVWGDKKGHVKWWSRMRLPSPTDCDCRVRKRICDSGKAPETLPYLSLSLSFFVLHLYGAVQYGMGDLNLCLAYFILGLAPSSSSSWSYWRPGRVSVWHSSSGLHPLYCSVYTGVLFFKNCFKATKFGKIYFFVL